MQDYEPLVLEIAKQDSFLSAGVFKQEELASTIRHYSQHTVNFSEIDKLCDDVLFLLNKATKKNTAEGELATDLRKTGKLLWDHLLPKHVKETLRSFSSRCITLFLDEQLIHIPWELLYDGEDFLCIKYSVGRLIRAKQRPNPPRHRSATSGILRMLILANPTDDLKSAYREGVYIKNQLDRRRKEIRVDFKSTSIDVLYLKRNLCDYDLVHFAGHCEYSPDYRKTGWILSDGRLTTQDILKLGEGLSFPDLIFSHACHSAKTPAESLDAEYQGKTYSLASAFLFSGVRHYIGTIWKIEDPVSLVFAQTFYSQLLKGVPIGECMRLGRLQLAKERDTALAWASYLLYGDPCFVLFPKVARKRPLALKGKARHYRRFLIAALLGLCIIAISAYFFTLLPTKNPNAYFLFLRSQGLFRQGKNEATISLARTVIQKDPLFLSAYPLLADACQRLGRKDEALRYYFDYAMHSERKRDRKNLAAAYIGIGWVYSTRGEYPKAFEFYNKAITLSREARDSLHEAQALRKLAVWYIDTKDYAQALELLMKSSEINRERQHVPEHRYNLACDYFDIGLVFANKNDYPAAREFYKKSSALFEKLKLKNEMSDCYFNLGEIYLFEKEYRKALEYYLEGLRIDVAQNNRVSVAEDYTMIGELQLEMDNIAEAEKAFIQAVSIAKPIGAFPELALAYRNLGLLYKKIGKRNKAREYFRNAQEIYGVIDPLSYQEMKKELLDLSFYSPPRFQEQVRGHV